MKCLLLAAAALVPTDEIPELDAVPVEMPGGPGARYPGVVAGPGPAGFALTWIEVEETGAEAVAVGVTGDPLGSAWARTAVEPEARLFVNWADFPALALAPAGQADAVGWLAWLEHFESGGYGARVGRAVEAAADPAEPRWLHAVQTGPEFGFVSLVTLGESCFATWLDGRAMAGHDAHGHGAGEMQLRAAVLDADGLPGPELVLDERTCECCQTDAARLDDGRVMVVWRDRGADEVRDVAFALGRPGEPDSWSQPALVHADGWKIEGCPVNGPGLAARGGRVAVAWYTAGGGRTAVNLALFDAGAGAFGAPVRVDLGAPVGRVDVQLLSADLGIVTWAEWGARAGELVWHARAFDARGARGRLGEPLELGLATGDRAAGFLRMAASSDGAGALAAWTVPGEGLAGAWIEPVGPQEPAGTAR